MEDFGERLRLETEPHEQATFLDILSQSGAKLSLPLRPEIAVEREQGLFDEPSFIVDWVYRRFRLRHDTPPATPVAA
jgi:hypothetical protein